jgi:hypothetical protein
VKQLRLRTASAVLSTLAILGSGALLTPHKAIAQSTQSTWFNNGATYVTTVEDSKGAFASRGVITLHADHTLAVIDSGQGGPTYHFSSQLGSWSPDGKGGLVGKAIDFDYPPNADVARLDYTISFTKDGTEITGTITLTTFPLEGDPLGTGGTVAGTYTFTGELVKP